MSNGVNMFLSTVVVVIQAFTIYIYLGYFFKSKVRNTQLGCALLIVTLLSEVDLNVGTHIYRGKWATFAILFLIMLCWLQGDFFKKLFHYSFLSSFLLIQENMGKIIYLLVSGKVSLFFLGMYIIVFLFFIVLIRGLKRFKVEHSADISTKEYLILIPAPVLSSFFLTLNLIHNSGKLVIMCLLLLWFNISILYLYNYLTDKSYQVQMLQHEKLQSDFLRDFLQQAEEIRTLRHDLKNILASITYYAEQKDHIKIKELMTELSENVTFKNKYTGVLALDAVINQKVKAMIAKNIDYGLDLRVPNNLNLGKQELDVCAILGNILDNAIEATTKDIADPSIQLTLIYRKEKLVVKVTNPYLGKKRQNYNKVTVESSKQAGRQGIGLRSIKKRVAKYNGYYDFKVTNGKFTAFVILPLLS